MATCSKCWIKSQHKEQQDQTLNIAPSQVFTAAEYPIRQAAVAVSISGLEELQNSGEEAIIDLLEVAHHERRRHVHERPQHGHLW